MHLFLLSLPCMFATVVSLACLRSFGLIFSWRAGSGAVFTLTGMSSEKTFDLSTVYQHATGLLRNNIPGDAHMKEVFGLIEQRLHVRPRALLRINLEGPDTYLQVLTVALNFGICPRARRRPRGATLRRD